MPTSLLNGATQIRDATITAAKFVASLGLPTAQLAEGALFIKRDGAVAFTADQSHGGFKITNLGAPVSASDAATKAYVDAVVNGYDPKPSVDAVSTTNVVTLSGTTTIDGVALVAGDVVGLVGQTTQSQNGQWVIAAGAWTRPAWWTGNNTVTEGSYFLVQNGTNNKGTGWIVTTTGTITVDTTAVVFQQQQGANSSAVQGNGITVSGNVVSTRNGNGIGLDGSNANTIVLNGSSLNLGASGLKVTDAASPGQVMLGNASNAATFTTLSGDVSTVSSAGSVALAAGIRRSSSFVYNEAPTGTINGSNATFTLATTPIAGTVCVYLNGQRLFAGAGNDYTISAGTITMLQIPQTGERLTVDYQV